MCEDRLSVFVSESNNHYEIALAEINSGKKITHWMWYMFPQLKFLGKSYISHEFGIDSIDEAREYLRNTTLRENLITLSLAVFNSQVVSIEDLFPNPDNLKLRSCMTLFREADPSIPVFQKVLDKYFGGVPDEYTLQFLSMYEVELRDYLKIHRH